ncbi:uncharacterized protein DNG_01080 [Cephalotrichum gorgonifer]|uniref:Nuclear pore assembly and biogenesis-domain-containing protein n=1 Tax=Cephalotrichum gorgonifer TaxID=2041049 RepID=A0AAE8MR00_9PEZI|nr:uncharacterized protein DNG_01080 [Cephalotrichum gorgonifer]
MNLPSFLDLLNILPGSNDRSTTTTTPTLTDLNRYLAQLRPTESTTTMYLDALAQASTGLVSLLAPLPAPVLFALALVASLFVVRLVNRALTFFTRLLFQLMFWAFVVGVAAVFYDKGIEGTVALVRDVCGYVFDMGVFFWREWERYEKQRERGAGPEGAPGGLLRP